MLLGPYSDGDLLKDSDLPGTSHIKSRPETYQGMCITERIKDTEEGQGDVSFFLKSNSILSQKKKSQGHRAQGLNVYLLFIIC